MKHLTLARLGKVCDRLAGYARSLGRRVAAAASEPFRDRLAAGREFLDLHDFQLCLADELDAMRDELLVCDDRHAAERARCDHLRDRRDAWLAVLQERLVAVRDALSASYGAQMIRSFLRRFWPLPADADGIHQVAERFAAVLADPELELPPVLPGVEVDLVVVARSVAGPALGLGETLAELSESESAVTYAWECRNAARERLQVRSAQVEAFYQALRDLAGFERTVKGW